MLTPTLNIEMAARDVAALPADRVRWIDVREPSERASAGWISGAAVCGDGIAESQIAHDSSVVTVVVCATGLRSRVHAEQLRAAGHVRVVNLAGGIAAWREAGFSIEGGSDERFARQVALPQVGVEGQLLLGRARVLVVGVGGLGSPVVSYLAGAGVGVLGLADGDVVERSNLHRQPIHAEAELGASKVASAARAVSARFPDVEVVAHAEHVTAATVGPLLACGWDVVLDCTDDIGARLALSDAAVRAGVPLVHGAVDRFEGHVAVFGTRGGPCYRCLHPAAERAETRNCAEAGVLGVAPGVVGTLQASEALKLVLGIPSPLHRGVLVLDLLTMAFQTIPVSASPDCPVCAT